MSGKNDAANFAREGLNAFDKLQAVHLGHPYIRNHDIDRMFGCCFKGLLGRVSAMNLFNPKIFPMYR
ncbi:hypothetical protein D3C86_1964100 [compost metagenome]